MSKIRMAFFDDYSFIGIAFINPDGTRAAIKVNIPQRKRHMIKSAIKEGMDFPESKSAIILPPEELLRQEREKSNQSMIVEA